VTYQIWWDAQSQNSYACKELQKSDLSVSEGKVLCFGNFPQTDWCLSL
jgi:hypothetical protein